MNGYRKLLLAALCATAFPFTSLAIDKIDWQGGVQTGYNLGENGQGWPSASDPLANQNRGGFYIRQLRVKGTIPFDSTFKGVVVSNVLYADIQEAYLQKRWGDYALMLGKFRGAGLHSATGEDEFSRTTIETPRYARFWEYYKRTINYRDYGIQLEKDGLGGDLTQRFFIHNANRENVLNDEPSYPAGQTTQVLGMDYALDYRVSQYTVTGGHIGALANRQWSEFVGNHNGWEAGYWFKSNPIVDFSFYHQMDFTKLHILNEAMLLYNRDNPNPVDSAATKTWGVSTLLRFDHNAKYGSFFRYEFTDPTDGAVPDDANHIFTFGEIYHPAPVQYPGMKITGEYVRALEEGGRNLLGNDIFYVQLEMLF